MVVMLLSVPGCKVACFNVNEHHFMGFERELTPPHLKLVHSLCVCTGVPVCVRCTLETDSNRSQLTLDRKIGQFRS